VSAAARDPIAEAVFYVVLGCWVFFLAAFAVRARRAKIRETKREGMAIVGMALQFGCYFAVWLPVLQRKLFSAVVPMPAVAEWALAVATVAIACASVWLVDAASRRLGKQWGLAARLVEAHDLITAGPYGWVRNPIYLGMLGLLVATGLAVSRWRVLIVVTVVFVIGTVIRIRSEEQLLRSAFAEAFEEYARRVAALVPGIY
jgi:protein-S-isoprenylcysteine O-methyltransferase Ste14